MALSSRIRMRGQRRSLLLAAVAAVVASISWSVSWLSRGFLFPSEAGCRSPSRRDFIAAGLSGLVATAAADSASAVTISKVTEEDKQRLIKGFKDLDYMMNNWNNVTRKCDKNQDRITNVLASGQASPDGCIAQPDQVRKYLGGRSIKAPLFNTKALFINIEASGMVPEKDEDRFGELIDDFERYKREADEWAYSSSWAEANPGGGRDRTEDYLLRAKTLCAKATDTLREIMNILSLI
eukprot:gb/GFBE01081430.1/.p1 GENE.gb/GFBE01081430.1/~~gb/GFBE01081430.1/.p1  ORF type:complete len:238 (+),score=50.97 gb/GFBE01081430.1/:1-714(+)